MATMQKASFAARVSRRSSVVCRAQQASASTSRRALLGAALLPTLLYAPKALALIPDEEDESLVEKAKRNRQLRLQQQRGVTRDFLAAENLKDKSQELAPVQKAVYKLAKSGSQLESGELQAAAGTLSESWVGDFTSAAGKLTGADAAQKLAADIEGVQAAARAGNSSASKQQFVTLVADLQSWASANGLSSSLKGL